VAGILALAGWCALSGVAGEAHVPGKVLLVRGVLTVFSLGLDDLADRLRRKGLDVQIVPASLAFSTAGKIAEDYAAGRTKGPLVIIGHSLGGDLGPALARRFGRQGVPVDLLVMIDSTNPSSIPENVKRCVNLYQSNFSPTWFRIFRGAPTEAKSGQTNLTNIDIRELPEKGQATQLNHFNIEKSPWVHDIVSRELWRTFGREEPADIAATADEGTR
jgi:pimeloyl-ACP methyl ester carboxylesterase